MAEAEGVTFIKQKLPPHGQMPGVAFAASDMQTATDGPRIVIFSGARNGPCNEMWQWTPGGEGWMQIFPVEGTEMPHERTQSTLTSISDSQLILIGGFLLNIGAGNDVHRCTITLDDSSMPICAWEACHPSGEPPAPRYGHASTKLSGKIVVYGGQDDKVQMGDVHVLSSIEAEMVWSQPSVSGKVPRPRMKHTATAVADGTALIFGGFKAAERCLDDAWFLELKDNGEVRFEDADPQAPAGSKPIPPRSQHTACATSDGKFVYLYGGYDGDKNLNDLWLLDMKSMTLRSIGVN